MGGLYANLLDALDDLPPGRAVAAVRAVVERHKPFTRGYVMTCCAGCSIPADDGGVRYHFLVDHPCQELRVIAEQLGISTDQGEAHR